MSYFPAKISEVGRLVVHPDNGRNLGGKLSSIMDDPAFPPPFDDRQHGRDVSSRHDDQTAEMKAARRWTQSATAATRPLASRDRNGFDPNPRPGRIRGRIHGRIQRRIQVWIH